jgi:hypothetical protein
VGQVHSVDFTVNPAGAAEQITVTDQANFDTGSAKVGVNVSPAEDKQLPLNGRQLSQLYVMAPGAVNAGTGGGLDRAAAGGLSEGELQDGRPDFDLAFLQSRSVITKNAASLRLDYKAGARHSFYLRSFRNQARSDKPEGVTGRRAVVRAQPQNAVVSWQQVWTPSVFNELKVGFNEA